jgi:hypothetical protein
MAISNKEWKVIDLAAYRKKRFTYDIDPRPEFPKPWQLGYSGTYTPQAPYGRKEQGEEDADRYPPPVWNAILYGNIEGSSIGPGLAA